MNGDISVPRFDGVAACAETDPDAFYPESGGEGRAVAKQARRVCRGCELIDPCLKWALDTAEPFGIWGGLTERERRAVTGRRRRRVA